MSGSFDRPQVKAVEGLDDLPREQALPGALRSDIEVPDAENTSMIALVLGIVSMVLFPLLTFTCAPAGLVSTVLGSVAWFQARKVWNHPEHGGRARIGGILGLVSAILAGVMALATLAFILVYVVFVGVMLGLS